jgi:putative copper resistance protein D
MLTVFLPLVIARWIHFASVFVMFGSPLFWLCAGHGTALEGPLRLPRSFRATLVLLRAAAPLAAVSGAAWLACILINMTQNFGRIFDREDLRLFFFETPFGAVSILRLALLVLCAVIVFLPWGSHGLFAALLPAAALLLITQAWYGHAAEGAGLHGVFTIAVYSIHALAAAAWVGGLLPLLFAIAEPCRSGPARARACSLNMLSRFSLMAAAAVTLIVLSGAVNAGLRGRGSLGKLFGSDYGGILIKKIALVAAMLGFACINRFLLMPRLRAAALDAAAVIMRLRWSIAIELALGVLVLGMSALLGIAMPPE